MRIKSPLLWKTAGLLGTMMLRTWTDTIDYKWAFYDPEIDGAYGRRHYILLFWHEYILGPLFLRRQSDVTMLLSQHGDAEIVGRFADHLGMTCVRGSTFKGGAAAVKQILELKEHPIVAFTPDGPRGPRRQLAVGPVYLASKLRMPLVLLGVGYDRPWRANSWDRFALPRPFSRGRLISSPFLEIPKRLNKEDLEYFRVKTESLLNELTTLAENWAASGDTVLGESIVCPGPKSSLMYYGNSRPVVVESFPRRSSIDR